MGHRSYVPLAWELATGTLSDTGAGREGEIKNARDNIVESRAQNDQTRSKKKWSEIVSVVERSAPCKVPIWCRHKRMHENTFLYIALQQGNMKSLLPHLWNKNS